MTCLARDGSLSGLLVLNPYGVQVSGQCLFGHTGEIIVGYWCKRKEDKTRLGNQRTLCWMVLKGGRGRNRRCHVEEFIVESGEGAMHVSGGGCRMLSNLRSMRRPRAQVEQETAGVLQA